MSHNRLCSMKSCFWLTRTAFTDTQCFTVFHQVCCLHRTRFKKYSKHYSVVRHNGTLLTISVVFSQVSLSKNIFTASKTLQIVSLWPNRMWCCSPQTRTMHLCPRSQCYSASKTGYMVIPANTLKEALFRRDNHTKASPQWDKIYKNIMKNLYVNHVLVAVMRQRLTSCLYRFQ